jgi:hypothetical protein
MIGLLCFVLAVMVSPFKSKARLEAGPSDEAKEPAIAHIPKPTAPTPANSFNPLVIMACAPKTWRRRLHARLPTIAGCASTGHAHAFTSSCFVYTSQVIFGIVGFNTRCFVSKTMCRLFL